MGAMTTPDQRKVGDAKAMTAERALDDQAGRQAVLREAAAMRAATARTAARLTDKASSHWPVPEASWAGRAAEHLRADALTGGSADRTDMLEPRRR